MIIFPSCLVDFQVLTAAAVHTAYASTTVPYVGAMIVNTKLIANKANGIPAVAQRQVSMQWSMNLHRYR